MKLKVDPKGPSLYPVLLAGLLATGWLLPNHYAPWNAFHTNAWTAVALLLMAFWWLAVERAPVQLSRAGVALAALSLLPWLQHAIGLVPLTSDALLSSLYLLGLAAAFIFGEHWARLRPGAPVGMVLGAAAASSVLCVCLQIYQWLGFAGDPTWQQFWLFGSGASRPYANLGQPNQLASLLLWGALGAAWAWYKRWLRAPVAIGLAAFILFGVALTESRTAALTLTVTCAALTLFRPACVDRKSVRVFQVLYVFYLVALFGLEPLSHLAGQDTALTVFKRSAGEVRVVIWRMALDAASTRPWLGFGWNHTNEAYLAVFPRFPALADMYLEQSHNIVLDLLLWVGLPLTALIVLVGAWWLWRLVRSALDFEQLLALGALAVMLVHAMLELPLHYGYFLWPFALIAGAATARLGWPAVALVPRAGAAAASFALSVCAAAVIHDYFLVDAAFRELRFQLQHIGHGHDESRPDVLLLDDWADFIAMSRATPAKGMAPEEIRRWQDLLIYNTSPLAFRKVIGAFSLNGYTREARYWGERSCAVMEPRLCQAAQREWVKPDPRTAP